MSKAEDFTKNSMEMILGDEAASDAANKRNRDIVRIATDAELQEIVDQMRGIMTLESLKEARETFRKDIGEVLEN